MKSLWQVETRREILARLDRLTPLNPRRWGRMTAPQMLAHLNDGMRLALGDIPVGPARGPLRFWPLGYFALHWSPWPEGKVRGPREAFLSRPLAWDEDHRALVALIGRFAAADRSGRWPHHPLFGRMSGRDWGVCGWRHLDHHLRQFSA